jgi:hypothetical protein
MGGIDRVLTVGSQSSIAVLFEEDSLPDLELEFFGQSAEARQCFGRAGGINGRGSHICWWLSVDGAC